LILITLVALLPLVDIIEDGNFNFFMHINFKNLSIYAEYLLLSLLSFLLLGHIDYFYVFIFINYFKIIVIYLLCCYFFFIKLKLNFKQKLLYVVNYFRKLQFLQTSQAILPFV
jgi:hypothetical protein